MVLFEKCRSRSIRKGHTTKISPIECPTRKRARSFATKPPPPPSFLNILLPLLRYLIPCELKWHVSLSPPLKRRASIPSSHSSRSSYAAMAHRKISVLFFLLCALWKSFFVLPVARSPSQNPDLCHLCILSPSLPPSLPELLITAGSGGDDRSGGGARPMARQSVHSALSLSLSLSEATDSLPPEKTILFLFFIPSPLFPPPFVAAMMYGFH